MALRNEDKDWIHAEIRAATDSLRPHGWRKAVLVLRQLGPLATVVGIFVALLGITAGAIYFGVTEVGKNSEFRGATGQKLTNIDARLERIETTLLTLRAVQAANRPADKKNIAEAKVILDTAKRSAIQLPTDVVEQSGKAFMAAASKEPAAWNVALAFLSYRSTLNAYVRTVTTVNVPAGAQTRFEVESAVAGKPSPTFSHIPVAVAPKDAARFESIGKNLNQQLQFGTAQLVLTGGAVSLDDKYVRHAVLENVEVHYTGRPLILQDVLFVNCTFMVENTLPGRQLGQVVLASSSVNFEVPTKTT